MRCEDPRVFQNMMTTAFVLDNENSSSAAEKEWGVEDFTNKSKNEPINNDRYRITSETIDSNANIESKKRIVPICQAKDKTAKRQSTIALDWKWHGSRSTNAINKNAEE